MAVLVNGIGADTISVKKKSIESITNLVEELVINKVRMENLKTTLTSMKDVKILEQELRIISEVQDAVKRLNLVELNVLVEAVRNCVKEGNLKKEADIQLIIEGMDTEVEHTVLEYMLIILLSLIENYFEEDGVLDTPSNTITVQSHSDGKTLTMKLETMNNSKICSDACRALNKNAVDLMSLSEKEMKDFLSKINSEKKMDQLKYIKPKMVSIGGSVLFESISKDRRRVTISIPLITAVMKGMLVTVGSQTMVLPSDFVETIIKPKNLFKFEENKKQGCAIYMDQIISLVDIGELMCIKEDGEESTVLIVGANGSKMALIVDSVIDQTDLVIKPKHSVLNSIIEVKGTTVLGDGEVMMVLDIPAIIKSKSR